MTRQVVFSRPATQDIDDLFEWIADRASPQVALAYTDRLERFCRSLVLFPERARPVDFASDVRIVTFERRTNIGYVVTPDQIVIVGIDHGGRQSLSNR